MSEQMTLGKLIPCDHCDRAFLPNGLALHRRSFSSLERRFWLNVPTASPADCWEWQGNRDRRGYGLINVTNRHQRAHRIAWVLRFGDLPAEACVLHRCDNPPCVNPDHLFLGTQQDNLADMVSKDRHRSGNHNGEKTHCKRGHLFDDANTRIVEHGRRKCRACDRDRARQIRARSR